MPADPHVVAVLAMDGAVGFDLAILCQVFGLARLPGGDHPYQVRVCGTEPSATATAGGVGHYRIEAPHGLDAAEEAGTVVVPGMVFTRPTPPEVVDLLKSAACRGVRTVSICTGAFASAGVAAGLDLCLHLVRRDFGAAVAASVARVVVMPPTRDGDQAQFIPSPPLQTGDGSLAATLAWMREQAAKPLTLAEIARHANMSTRTLTRRFRDQTGTTALDWLARERLQLARELLETSDLPVPVVAERSGHGSATALRAHFDRELRTSPNRYRRSFRLTDGP